jgi:CRP-like cAMP-binding protein
MARPRPEAFEPFFTMVSARDTLSAAERATILAAAGEARSYAAGEDIVDQGERPLSSTLVTKGMTGRYSTVEDGGRQITGLHIAGDFVDLHSFPLKLMDHAVTAIGPTEIISFPHARLVEITEQHPHLTRVLWMLTLLDGAIHRQWMVTKGRLTADEQMAHLFCEQYVRARTAGLATGNAYPFPLTQMQFGDALGLSYVHTNRTLQRLRRTGALDWEGGVVTIHNWPLLMELAQFDPTYLHLETLPR